jgi:hypothetical protein
MEAGENIDAVKQNGCWGKYGRWENRCTQGKNNIHTGKNIYAVTKCVLEKSVYVSKKKYGVKYTLGKNMYAGKNVCTLGKNIYVAKKYVRKEKIYTLGKSVYVWQKYVRREKVCTLGKNMYAGKNYIRLEKICTLGKSAYAEKKICLLGKSMNA